MFYAVNGNFIMKDNYLDDQSPFSILTMLIG